MKKYMFALWFLALCFCCHNLFASSAWNQKTNFGGEARHRAIGFSIGNRGYMGLGHVNSVVDVLYEDIWEYDPGTNSWTQKANFGGGFRFHAVAFTIGNKGYVGTGRVPSGFYENDLWEYDPVTNIWTQKTDMPALERRGAVAFVVNGEGYIGTGQTMSGNANDFMKYNPTTDSWSPVATFIGFARTSAVGFAINNKGYVGTGGANDFYEYDPLTDSWSVKANVGPTSRQEATGFVVNGKGYIGTGDNYSSGDNYGDFWEYDPLTDTWTQIEDFGGIARRYLSSFTIGSKAYCGTGTSGTNYRDFWEFDPALMVSTNDLNKPEVQVSIYPNPVATQFTIRVNNIEDNMQVNVLNSAGQTVFTQKQMQPTTSINCGNWEKGNYLVQVTGKTGNPVVTKKIIVE